MRTAGPLALAAANLAWPVLDSKFFDGAIKSAKGAVAGYVAKKAFSSVAGLMGRGKKKNVLAVVEKASRGPVSSGRVVLRPLGSRGPPARRAGTNSGPRFGRGRRRVGGFSGRSHRAPLASGRTMVNKGPSMNNGKSIVVQHSEYIGEVSGSVAFNNQSYPINPGLAGSFPWLNNIATQYEQYKIRQLNYRYETDASATKKGAVVLVTDFDALDTPFLSKAQAMQYKGASRTVTWQRIVHSTAGRERSPYGLRYVRSGAVPAGGDQKTYDVGLFQIITEGQDDGAVIGELYIDYTVELIGPKVNNVLGQNLLCADIRSGGTMSPAAPLGSAPQEVDGTNITVGVNGGSSMTLGQSGRFLVVFSLVGTGLSAIALTPGGGATVATDYGGAINAAGTNATYSKSIDYTANQGQGITFTATGSTITGGSVVISQISSGLYLKKPKPRMGLPKYEEKKEKDEAIDAAMRRLVELEALVRSLGVPRVSFDPGQHITPPIGL